MAQQILAPNVMRVLTITQSLVFSLTRSSSVIHRSEEREYSM